MTPVRPPASSLTGGLIPASACPRPLLPACALIATRATVVGVSELLAMRTQGPCPFSSMPPWDHSLGQSDQSGPFIRSSRASSMRAAGGVNELPAKDKMSHKHSAWSPLRSLPICASGADGASPAAAGVWSSPSSAWPSAGPWRGFCLSAAVKVRRR